MQKPYWIILAYAAAAIGILWITKRIPNNKTPNLNSKIVLHLVAILLIGTVWYNLRGLDISLYGFDHSAALLLVTIFSYGLLLPLVSIVKVRWDGRWANVIHDSPTDADDSDRDETESTDTDPTLRKLRKLLRD